jgi:hypothetical protein
MPEKSVRRGAVSVGVSWPVASVGNAPRVAWFRGHFGVQQVPPLVPPRVRVFSALATDSPGLVKAKIQQKAGCLQASETQKEALRNFGTEGFRFDP